jgi:hypothetical protein
MFRRYAVILLLLSGLGTLGALTASAQSTPKQPVFPPYQGNQYNNVSVLVNTHDCYVYPSTASDPQASDGNPDCYYNSARSASMAYSVGGAAGISGLGSSVAQVGASVSGSVAYSQSVTTAIDSQAIPYALDNPFLTSTSGSGVTVAPGQPLQISWAFQDYMTVYQYTKNACGLFGMFTCNNDTPSTVQMYGTPTANFDLSTCSATSDAHGKGRSSSVCNLSGTVTVNPTQSTTYTITAPITITESSAQCNAAGGGGGHGGGGGGPGGIRFSTSHSTSTIVVPMGTNPSQYCTPPPSVSNPSAAFQFSYLGTTTVQGRNSSADQYLVTYTSSDFGGTETIHTTLSIPVIVSGEPFAVASLTFASNPIAVGQTTTATWSVANAANCALTNSYGGVDTGARTDCATSVVTPTPTYATSTTDTYTLFYTDENGTSYFPTYTLSINNSVSSSCKPGNLLQGCSTQPGNGGSQSPTSTPSFAPPPAPPPALSLVITPARVRKGQTALITWSATNVNSCSLNGPGVSASCDNAAACAASTQTPTQPINAASVYTLTCGNVSQSQTVNLLPSVKEL